MTSDSVDRYLCKKGYPGSTTTATTVEMPYCPLYWLLGMLCYVLSWILIRLCYFYVYTRRTLTQ